MTIQPPRDPEPRGGELSGHEAAIEVLRRWVNFGATWRVIDRTGSQVTISLCRCDGGEEVEQFTSSDPALLSFLGRVETVNG